MTLKDHQDNLLKIAQDFHNYCEANNFQYFMGFGTFLGAVRHKGFIPWDDDLDFLMWRDEYNKFIFDVNNNPNNPFEVNNNKFNGLPILSIKYKKTREDDLVLFDLFPIDYLPEKTGIKYIKRSRKLAKVFFIKNSKLLGLLKKNTKQENNILIYLINILKRVLIKIFYPYTLINSKFQKKIKAFKESSICFDGLNFSQTVRQPRKSSLFKMRKLYKFESINLYGVEDFDDYLKGNYGNYMKIPDNKISHRSWES